MEQEQRDALIRSIQSELAGRIDCNLIATEHKTLEAHGSWNQSSQCIDLLYRTWESGKGYSKFTTNLLDAIEQYESIGKSKS